MSLRGSSSGHGNTYERSTSRSGSTSSGSGTSREESSFKLVMIGDSGVGKSCILERLLDDSSTNAFISTIGVDIKRHTLTLDGGRTIKLQVWDTGGQQRYRHVLSTCYRNAVGIVVVFDVTNRKSFANLDQWMREVDEFSSCFGRKEATPKLLMGNKCDLEMRREVDYETASKFAEERNMTYLETSAVTATSAIRDGFVSLIRPRLESCPSSSSQ